jgi:hypothetical protein
MSLRTLKGHISTVMLGRRSRENRVLDAKFTRSAGFTVFYMVLTVLPYLVMYVIRLATDPRWHNGCYGCEIDTTDCIFLVTVLSFSIIISVMTLSFRVQRRDTLRIVRECLYVWIFGGTMCVVGYILLAIDPGQLYRTHGLVNWKIFILLSYPWTIYAQTLHQVIVAKMLKQQLIVSNLFGRGDRFVDVMKDKVLKEDLRQHLNRELSSEILLFLEAVDEFKSMASLHISLSSSPDRTEKPFIGLMNGDVYRMRVKRIYDMFIKKGAPDEINIGSNLREDVLLKIIQNNQGDVIDFGVFDQAYEEVKNNLLKDGFARFLNKVVVDRKNRVSKKTIVISTSIDSDSKAISSAV